MNNKKTDREYEEAIRQAQIDNQYRLECDDTFNLRGKQLGRRAVHTIGSGGNTQWARPQ